MELIGVETKSEQESLSVLTHFKEANNDSRSFPCQLAERKKIWESLFKIIKTGEPGCQYEALNCARILSRDAVDTNQAVSEEMVDTLLRLGHIETGVTSQEDRINVESLKVLSNLMHGCVRVQRYCSSQGFLSKLLDKISGYSNFPSSEEAKIFDFRLLFLFTALLPEQRELARHNLQAVNILLEVIKTVLCKSEMSAGDGVVVCEVLKVLFNISVNSKAEDTAELVTIASTLRDLIRMKSGEEETRQKIVCNVVNVVTNMEGRPEALQELLETSQLSQPGEPDVLSQGVVVNVLDSFLQLLQHKLSGPVQGRSLKEEITPCLSVLWNFSRSSRPARKYLRSVILPPLTAEDVKVKPEDGDSLKGRLVSLMTNSSTGDISNMVAELLYAICKENVGRLVKHTGYGNAAGLLARRGLMLGGRGGNYSSDEESDTEEYKEVRDQVNPITASIDEPRVNPLEGMSDEQKEYEAMKLVNLMDKMERLGLVQPARVGPDGKPEAVSHVCQLIENQNDQEDSHGDSD